MDPIDLIPKISQFTDHWSPKIVGSFNGHDLMVVKLQGQFVWHDHPDSDDFFMVLSGQLMVDLPDGTVTLNPGQVYVVPAGVQHRPRADIETHVLLIEPAGTPNTGDTATAVVKQHL